MSKKTALAELIQEINEYPWISMNTTNILKRLTALLPKEREQMEDMYIIGRNEEMAEDVIEDEEIKTVFDNNYTQQ